MPTEYDTRRQRWITVVNDTTEYVPAYAAVQITGIIPLNSTTYPNHSGEFLIGKPTRDNRTTGILFNSGAPIPPKGTGMATAEFPTVMAYEVDPDAGSGSTPDSHPVADDSLGVQADEWLLLKGNRGFQSLCTGRSIDSLTGITAGTINLIGASTSQDKLIDVCFVPCTSGEPDPDSEGAITGSPLEIEYRVYLNGSTPPAYKTLTASICTASGQWQFTDNTPVLGTQFGIVLGGTFVGPGGSTNGYAFDFPNTTTFHFDVPANPCDGFDLTSIFESTPEEFGSGNWVLDIKASAQACLCSESTVDDCPFGFKIQKKYQRSDGTTYCTFSDESCDNFDCDDGSGSESGSSPTPPEAGGLVYPSCCVSSMSQYWKLTMPSTVVLTGTPTPSILGNPDCCTQWVGDYYLTLMNLGLSGTCGTWMAVDNSFGVGYGVFPGNWLCDPNYIYNAFGANGHSNREVRLDMESPVDNMDGTHTFTFSLTIRTYPRSGGAYPQLWAAYSGTKTTSDTGEDATCPTTSITLTKLSLGPPGLGNTECVNTCTFPNTITLNPW